MIFFLASVLEQLDLAMEHLTKRDVHNARFSLMLTDNAVELVLHQIAKDKKSKLNFFRSTGEEYRHQKALDKAVLRSFEDKVIFARLEGHLTLEEAQTLNIMHEFRNELYHLGLSHEEILPALAGFHFSVACQVISRFSPPGFHGGQIRSFRMTRYRFVGHTGNGGRAARRVSPIPPGMRQGSTSDGADYR